jgi:SAM-dependent methyltransferase
MDGYRESTYGDSIADIYDAWHSRADTQATVDRLALLAEGGPVLELAVGTGRVALPLAERGLTVDGIDASPAMLRELAAKPGGDKVTRFLGDMADVATNRDDYGLAFVVFNSFFCLPTQDDQVHCFANVAARLRPGGCFTLECFVPDLARFDRGQRSSVTHIEVETVRLDVSLHHPIEQRVETQHVLLAPTGVRLVPVSIRYAWPSELDLMAKLAGLTLQSRWAGWRDEPFGEQSGVHVSVYRKPS